MRCPRITLGHLVPFIIRLRDYANEELPRPHEYPLKLARNLPDAPNDWMDNLLNSGRALVMFDGADELPPNRRKQAINEIRELIEDFPDNAFVVTARTEAVSRRDFHELGFLSARVEPLSPAGRNTFIDRWHDAMELRLRNRNEPKDLRPTATALKERLDETPSIARLAVNPLLCAAVCALHLERSDNLPDTPVELCENLCIMMLKRRDDERPGMHRANLTNEDYSQLDYARRKGLLSQLAHWMVLNGLSAVTENETDERIAEGLKSYGLPDLEPGGVRQGLMERSGMLQESSNQTIEFLHNTLKEYLAAERFTNFGDYKKLALQCFEESWQPVILFAVAFPRDGSEFASQLLRAVWKKTPQVVPKGRGKDIKSKAAEVRTRQFFFLRCCTTAHQIADKVVQRGFNKLSAELLPPRNMPDAEALAMCGEPVVPYLKPDDRSNASTRAACVRTLATIGGARALRYLEQFWDDPSAAVGDEFLRLIRTGSNLAARISLSLTGISNVDWSKTAISEVSALASFPEIKTLNLSETPISDVSPIACLKNLEVLDLSHTSVSYVSALANLRSLQTLNLSHSRVKDITFFAKPARARSHALTVIDDIFTSGLRTLDLRFTEVNDVSALQNVTSLQTLNLANTEVCDVSFLSSLTNLKTLDLRFTCVVDVSPLASLSGLQTLFLYNTQVERAQKTELTRQLPRCEILSSW